MKKGKLIVIDGTDGSGKATQIGLLSKRLKKAGYKVRKADFPRYGKKSAMLVEEYLNGKFGKAEDVTPYQGSIFYASDRYAASFQVKKWLSEGKIVLANRYVTANMGHQGGKIKDKKERKKFFRWLYDLEYNIFLIPKPDVNLILHVNAEIAQKLIDKKVKRNYIAKGTRDIHENDLDHLRSAEKSFQEIARTFSDIQLVECIEDNKIMDVEKISAIIWERVKKIL